MNSHPVINYESAVSVYMDNLTTMLRGFVPAEENRFLETWVPDEDPVRSILGILEAAQGAGVPVVTVRVGAETRAALDMEVLRSGAARLGRAEIGMDGQTLVLTLSCQSAESFDAVNRLYRGGLEAAAQSHQYEGVLEPAPELLLVSVSLGHAQLMALVAADGHIVRKARHSGTPSEIERALLEKFCSILEGKPILECGDHAVIELEHELRDHTQPPPVPGAVMPENCGPLFALPLCLIRGMLADYRRQASFESRENFYVRPSSPRWHALSRVEKLREIAGALERFPGGSNFHLIDLKDHHRVIIEIPHVPDHRENRLLQLEYHLRQTVERTLEVHLEPKVDLNTIRKIKGGEQP